MTDRIHSLTLVLDKDIRDDDAETLAIACHAFHGVVAVQKNVTDATSLVAEARARHRLIDRILTAVQDG